MSVDISGVISLTPNLVYTRQKEIQETDHCISPQVRDP